MVARPAAFKQSDVTRAVKGAMAAGMTIHEVVATKDGIRIISSAGAKVAEVEAASSGESAFQKWKKNNANNA